ncbi:MAG: PAS domain S-box protein [Anaerolineae bacterium]|nr:PAS domain S-box protein [Anaerolineae bacterium]
MDKLLRCLLKSAAELLDADQGGIIHLYDPATEQLTAAEGVALGAKCVGQALHQREDVAGRVLATGQTITVEDYQTWDGRSATCADLPIGMVMAIPLRWRDQVIGVMSLMADHRQHSFGDQDIRLAELIAAQAAVAISHVRLLSEIHDIEERFLDIALCASDLLWELDARGNVTYCSEHIRSVLGYSPSEVVGKPAFVLLAPELAKYSEKLAVELISGGESLSGIEVWCSHKNGQAVCIALDAKTITNPSGEVVGYRGVARDITAQKAAEQREQLTYALGQYLTMVLSIDEIMEAMITHLLETLEYYFVGIHLLEEDGRQLVIQRGMMRNGRQLNQGEASIFLDQEPSLVARAARLRTPVISNQVNEDPHFLFMSWLPETQSEAVFPLLRGNQLLGVMDVQSAQLNHFGKAEVRTLETLAVQAAIAIENARLYQDLERQAANLEELVTERTREVVRERERLKVIVDNADDGIVFTGPDGKIEYANPVWERTSGYPAEDLIGKTLCSFMESEADKDSRITSSLRRGETWQGEISARRPDGSEYDASVSITPVLDQQGQIANAVAVLRDITPQKQMEQMRKKYVANISHELRTPITSIKLYHGLIIATPSEDHEPYMNTIAEQIERLEHLVEDLLDFSRLDRGVFLLRPTDFSLNDLVQDILRAHTPQANERNVQISASLVPDLPLLHADRHRIAQVLSNLLTNAINYTLPGGEVRLCTSQEEINSVPCLKFGVWDTGVGIAPQDLPFIFERFFRAENAKAAGVPGTGLGLSIAKEIVDLHHGRIRVESSLSKGSSFTIYLPIRQPVENAS